MLTSTAKAWEIAARVKAVDDVELPVLPGWNYEPCSFHLELTLGCRDCGVKFRKHQRKGIAWAYFVQRGLLADAVGTGKTPQICGNIALRRMKAELHHKARAVIIVKPQALRQWIRQFHRMLPHVPVVNAVGTVKERIQKYCEPWEVCIIASSMFINDYERLMMFPVKHLFVDDVDGLRNPDNKTAYTIKKLGEGVESVLVCTGTPLQKRLHELHSVLELMGGMEVFGKRSDFDRRYVRKEPVTRWTSRGRKVVASKVVGYKALPEFKRLLEPFALRRTADDIDDVDLPVILPNNVELEMYPAQAVRYADLRRGVIKIIKNEGVKVSQATAMAKIHTGARICAGLASLGEPDEKDTAVKLDWIDDKVQGDLSDEKVVIFVAYKSTIRAIHTRFDAAGIGYVTIWGDEPDKDIRAKNIDRFWEDPDVKVLIGTQAIEQSLDLQIARHLINVDQILNPSRMEQLAGRIRRDGSAFTHVYVHNLLCLDSQEMRYMPLLEREQALVDFVWDENSQLFEKLSPLALLQLIGDSREK